MATQPVGELVDIGNSLPQETFSDESFLHTVTSQTPWWIVSVLLHGLAFSLITLISAAIVFPEAPVVAMVTVLYDREPSPPEKPKPERDIKNALTGPIDMQATDKDSKIPPQIVIPPEVLKEMEIGDHIELNTPELKDAQSLPGNEEAKMIHSPRAVADNNLGGGGTEGAMLDEGIGAGGSVGRNGGRGGGDGGGFGPGHGTGAAQYGFREKGGRRNMAMRHGAMGALDAVERALNWLAQHQEPDGHWDTMKYESGQKTDTAMTGLALLAFLGYGHTEKVGIHKEVVRKAIAWLKSKQGADGMIFDSTDAGGHRGGGYPIAIATLALCEAAGMSNVLDTKLAAQKAVDYCTEIHQQGEGSDRLGWRYAKKTEGDTSVTGWFIMALKAARVAGLKVDHAGFDGAMRYLESVAIKDGDGEYGVIRYKYMVNNPHEHTQHRLTAIGTLCRQFLGESREMTRGSVDWFVQKGGAPTTGANGDSVDLYYWYYGTLSLYMQEGGVKNGAGKPAGGPLWQRWNVEMLKALLEPQVKNGDNAGSWNPTGAYNSEWGRVGQTALSALCLEVYYRFALLQK